MKSSMFSNVSYDEERQTLIVTYKESGAVYAYPGVPKGEYDALMAAGSMGQYFNKYIKPKHKGIKQ